MRWVEFTHFSLRENSVSLLCYLDISFKEERLIA